MGAMNGIVMQDTVGIILPTIAGQPFTFGGKNITVFSVKTSSQYLKEKMLIVLNI
jgi:hypothetical protein